MWYVVPYDIFGAKMWAVENANGYVLKYCSTYGAADSHCKQLNGI